MVEILTTIYLAYMFITLYFLSLFTLTFMQNRKEIFSVPTPGKNYSVSILIPAYNEQDSIEETAETVLKSNYKNIVEVIIINDGSSDKTLEIAKKLERKFQNVIVFDKKNSGKADSLNQALKIAKGEIIGVVDADSYPDEHAISSMAGFFNDEKVGAVTTRILVRNQNNFLRKMQAIEYKVIAFSRKLLDFLDSIYVTPGPLALYRKSALEKINGFDAKNMTEDIEVTWHLVHEGYDVRMSFISKSTTVAPDTLGKWFKQRIRWNIGGYQTILKYKDSFFRKGMLGWFILPFFSISLVLGVFGLGIFFYRIFQEILLWYLSTKYSIAAQTVLIAMEDVNFNPSVLNFLGVVLFVFGMAFVFFALKRVNEHIREKEGFFNVIFYSLTYIMLRPLVVIISLYKFFTGNYSWR
ncbi:glycosyltransferase family 2 protein [Candidatus Pacearchaeota archaeon]|nr:glycosyltransferase family 2 protein [Candidatus Pacearchaeota archaeon]